MKKISQVHNGDRINQFGDHIGLSIIAIAVTAFGVNFIFGEKR